jgi:RNA polymerase sigma-70 factor (ECF subfamily)
VQRFQAGDESAFRDLYLMYAADVTAYALVALRDASDAQDVTQQVFMRAFEALPHYQHRGRRFDAWLFRIVRNCVVDHRRQAVRSDTEEPAVLDRMRVLRDIPGPAWGEHGELHRALARLPLPQRQVVTLRFLLDLDVKEVAALLERTPAGVRQIQHRALTALARSVRLRTT